MTDIREHIIEKIEKLKKERDEYVTEVNRQLAAQNGAIAVLEQILEQDIVASANGHIQAELAEVLKG